MTAFSWSAARVREALGLPGAEWDHAYSGISTDTRTLREGELFVALKGERFDAHDLLGDARAAGVGGAVVRSGTPRWPGMDWFEVDDTLKALGDLAAFRRRHFKGPVVAITGSNGKTSTKELVAAALGPKYVVHKSRQNLNNLVGVPLTVLAAPEEATALVVECGASEVGELGRMREIVSPDVGVVTMVGAGHLEGFGGPEGVMAEKVSLLRGVATAVVGVEPPSLPARSRGEAKRVISAGLSGADWYAEEVSLDEQGRARFRARGVEVRLPLRGRHMVHNALIALAVAEVLGVPLEAAAAALEAVNIPGGRSEVVEVEGVTVINDCYNSNPQSLAAALELATAIRRGRRLIVAVGTMRELGEASER
ncbi:MAG TPA: UDP-N-acetylmuramoyl-tripeptide--D-alanyl-D-alanine ligase, partial [Gemmatimonadales bacterium]|nr:UDP-N-acetylmuramoyl-tripeptide--D-alanyl-D-alanine ligase [Gemmatimonadales bacterium]